MFWRRNKTKPKLNKCSVCCETHSSWPALTYNSPVSYNMLSSDLKQSIGKLDSDFCTIEHKDQTDRFIRVVLFQKVIDSNQDLNYGLWVSLSEKSFVNYSENFTKENHETQYFGWLNSSITEYDDTLRIPTTVYTKIGSQRPEIVPHEDHDHQFIRDYYSGISKIEAEKRIHLMKEYDR